MKFLHNWLKTRQNFKQAYICFCLLSGFSLFEANYFWGFPILEFLEFIFALLCINFSVVFFILSPQKISKYFGYSFFSFALGLNIFYTGHHLMFGTPPTSNVYLAIFETHGSEAREFFEAYLTLSVFLKGLLSIIVSIILFQMMKLVPKKVFLGFTLLFSFLTLPTIENLKFKSSFRMVNQYLIYSQEKEAFRKTFSKEVPSSLKITSQINSEDTVVVIIGESTTRKRMSLYGYARQTNPLLAKNQELFIYKNVISPHSHTVPSLEKTLTFLNFDNAKTLKENANVIQVAKLAGYKTAWLSNQPPLGPYETPLNVMANNADQTLWMSDVASFRYNNNLDENLLPLFSRALKTKGKKFILLHLIGTHTNYKHRYPQKFKHFKYTFEHKIKLDEEQWEDYNHYDNAVLYNDYVISEILAEAKNNPNTTVIYFSDHGEEVYDSRYVKGHNEALASNIMFEIPFLVYSNNSRVQDQINKQFSKNENELWSIEDLIHSLHDIWGIQTTFFEAKRSLFSDNFQSISRLVGGVTYNAIEKQEDCKARGMPVFTDKIWVHRVNSLERFQILKDDFPGFEIDVVWDNEKKYFDVNHPPVESIALNLEKMLEIDESQKKYFWLDFKNLSESNSHSAVTELSRLDDKFQLKKRILVESNQANSLKAFNEAGFYTSYYLPKFNQGDLAKNVEDIRSKINSYHSAISQSGSAIEFMDAKFSGCDKLVWVLDDEKEDKKKLEELKLRDDVKVILVKKNSKFRR